MNVGQMMEMRKVIIAILVVGHAATTAWAHTREKPAAPGPGAPSQRTGRPNPSILRSELADFEEKIIHILFAFLRSMNDYMEGSCYFMTGIYHAF